VLLPLSVAVVVSVEVVDVVVLAVVAAAVVVVSSRARKVFFSSASRRDTLATDCTIAETSDSISATSAKRVSGDVCAISDTWHRPTQNTLSLSKED
jgi:hypothetical protein